MWRLLGFSFDPMRKNFVTYDGKSTVISPCDEFLEMPYRISIAQIRDFDKGIRQGNEMLRGTP